MINADLAHIFLFKECQFTTHMIRKRWVIPLGSTLFILLFFFSSNTILSSAQSQINPGEIQKEDPIEFTYFYTIGCDICEEKTPIINNFTISHPDLLYQNVSVDYGILSSKNYFLNYTDSIGYSKAGTPFVVFNKTGCYKGLEGNEITAENLEQWYQTVKNLEGSCSFYSSRELSPWIIFVSGLVTGLSPCVILITAVMSSALLIQQDKSKLAKIFLGFLLGVLMVYLLLSWALVSTAQLLLTTVFGMTLRIIFAIIMFGLGFWYILDAYKEKSKLFSTPEKWKVIFAKWAKTGTFGYAFLLGFIFTFMKLPCVGGIFLALIYNMAQEPSSAISSMMLFYLGLLLPLVILMLILAKGAQTKKIDTLRIKYRPILRIVAGILIIALTIYSLFF